MIVEENVFPTSGKPNYLEWYECYRDLSKDHWIDGTDRLKLKNSCQKKKWDFFYQPIRALVGRPQKRMIQVLVNQIREHESEIAKYDVLIGTVAAAGVCLSFVSFFFNFYVGFFFFLAAGLFCFDTYINKEKILHLLEGNQETIGLLKDEIQSLKNQIPERPHPDVIEEWLIDEFKSSEEKALSDITHADIDSETIGDFIRHEAISRNGVRGLLLDCWGLLQPQDTPSPFGLESTGFRRVVEDIGSDIATWGVKSNDAPLYRVIYMQHIFLLDKNINVYGFFYDFVTRKQYGKRAETFQYGHITNFTINEVELSAESIGDRLGVSNALMKSLRGAEFNAFTLTVSSGVNFRCVLTTEAVIDGMNRWLEVDEEYKQVKALQTEDLDEECDKNKNLLDVKLSKKWDVDDKDGLNLDDIESELLFKKMELEDLGTSMADKVLHQVRLRVESPPKVEIDNEVA